jgi:Zn-dependent membrane protease YugP
MSRMTREQAKKLMDAKDLDVIEVRRQLTEHYRPNRDGLSDDELYSYLSNIQCMTEAELEKELLQIIEG